MYEQRQTTTVTSPVFSHQNNNNNGNSNPHHHNQSLQNPHQQQQMHFQSNTDGVTYSSSNSNNRISTSNSSNGSLDHGHSLAGSTSSGGITGFTFGASAQRSNGNSQSSVTFSDSLPPYDNPHPLRDTSSGRATPFPSSSSSNGGQSDADSGFGDEDCTRPINWGSVLSLSSQSALDPLTSSDLFATGATSSPLTPITPTIISAGGATVGDLPPTNIGNATSTSSAHHLKVLTSAKESSVDAEGDSGISMMEEDEDSSATSTQLLSIGTSSMATNSILRASGQAMTCSSMSMGEMIPSWLDMESELLPSLVPHQQARIVHDQEETGFTHIMVGS